MAITYGFFNSQNGDRKYTAAQVGDYLQGLCTSGVFADDPTNLQVISYGGMVVRVQPGRAMLNLKFLLNDAPLDFTLSVGGAQDRVDAIVAYMDMTERACGITVKQGTQAADPKAPAMVRNATRNEYMLASVRVRKLSSEITQVNITDTRGNEDVCGWVTGLIDQVPTGALLLQYQQACADELAAMQAYVVQQQQEFEAWFSALADSLNVIGFLQEYNNTVTLTEATNTINVGIADYDAQEDILLVNVGGLIWQRRDYTVSGTGDTAAVVLKRELQSGDSVEFRVIKHTIGTATLYSGHKLLAVDDSGVVLTDGSVAIETE